MIQQNREIERLMEPFNGLVSNNFAKQIRDLQKQQMLAGISQEDVRSLTAVASTALESLRGLDAKILLAGTAYEAGYGFRNREFSAIIDQAQAASAFWSANEVLRSTHSSIGDIASEILRNQDKWQVLLGTIAPEDLTSIYHRAADIMNDAGEDVEATAISPDEQAVSLVRWVEAALLGIARNTDARFREMGVFEIITLILLFGEIQAALTGSTFEQEDRDNITYIQDVVTSLSNSAEAVAKAEADRAAAIARLPRSVVTSKWATVRAAPNRAAEPMARLEQETNVALVKRSGRWSEIIFFDPITGQPTLGWVWSGSLELLD